MPHSPRSSGTTVATFCPSAVMVTVARGAERPAMIVLPSGLTRTMSKLGRITGSGAGAAVPAAPDVPLAVAAAPWVVFSVVATVALPAPAAVPELPVVPELAGAAVEAGAGAVPALP